MGICFSKAKKKKAAASSRQKAEQPLQEQKKELDHRLFLPSDQEQKIRSSIVELPEKEFTLSDKHVVENCSREVPAMADVAPCNPPLLNRTKCSSIASIPAYCSPHALAPLNPILFEPRSRSASPLSRSPTTRAGHEPTTHGLVRTLSIKAGLRSPASKLHYSPDDRQCAPRSRSLPKRFYSRDQPELDEALHKRSSSRDSSVESLLAGRKSLRRIPSMDCRFDNSFSPRLSMRREEVSGEYRIYARHTAAGRKSHSYETWTIPSSLENPKSRRKEKSPLKRASTGKVADADQFPYYHDELCSTQTRNACAMKHEHMRGTSALKDKSINCSYGLESIAQEVGKALPQALRKDEQKPPCEELQKPEIGRRTVEEQVCEQQHSQVESLCEERLNIMRGLDPVMAYEALQSSLQSPRSLKANNINLASESIACPALTTSMTVSELTLPTSLYSETEDSDNEVCDDTFDILQLALGPDVPSKMDLQAQQARNLLLKEAAMDAFARPGSHSTKLKDLKVLETRTCRLPDLTAVRGKETETDTLKVRNLLKLLSMAEPAMRPEQKTAVYNKLRTLLDSAGISALVEKGKRMNDGSDLPEKTGGERVLSARVNSWPRVVKQPVHKSLFSVPNNADQSMVTEFLTNLVDSEISRNSPATHGDLLSGPSVADFFNAESVKNHGLRSQELQLPRENAPTFVPLTENASEGKVLCLDLQTEQVSGHSLSNHAIKRPTNETDLYSTKRNNVDIACLPISRQEAIIAPSIDTGSRKPEAQAVIEWNQPSNCFPSNPDSNKSRYESTEDRMPIKYPSSNQLGLEGVKNCENKDVDEPKPITVEAPKEQVKVKRLPLLLVSEKCCQPQLQPVARPSVTEASSLRKCPDADNFVEHEELPHLEIEGFLNNVRPSRPSDVASDSSFEFRVRSNTSTPLSTPSTPMISTASTPRQLSDPNLALTAEEIAEIWDAFE